MQKKKTYAVFGLGRYGSAVAKELMNNGMEVIAVDADQKTVTAITLLCSALATIRGKKYASIFHRTISVASIRKAVAVVSAFMFILLSSTILLAACTDAPALDIIYETVSATATVGLSRNLTPQLNLWGKLVIIVTMYFGRVGPISLAVALGSKNETQNLVSDPPEEICIG